MLALLCAGVFPKGSFGAEPPAVPASADPELLKRYMAALQGKILRQWTRPESVPYGKRCLVRIQQRPGGEVLSVDIDPSCPYDEAGRRSVKAAVLKAQPLPYTGFESIFSRTVLLNFQAQDH